MLGADSVPVDGLNLRTQLSMGHKIFTLSFFFLPCSGSISSTVNSKWKPSLYLHVAEEAVSWSEDECGVHWSLHNAIFYPPFPVSSYICALPPSPLRSPLYQNPFFFLLKASGWFLADKMHHLRNSTPAHFVCLYVSLLCSAYLLATEW